MAIPRSERRIAKAPPRTERKSGERSKRAFPQKITIRLAGSYLNPFPRYLAINPHTIHRSLGLTSYSAPKPVQHLSTSTATPYGAADPTHAPTSARPDSRCEGSDRYISAVAVA